ncbi:MAG TPA: MOSC N-terminal beta barrel domain-containing protein [Rubrivivax sp.]|nr:MOSC N-terminal beta barrel domain-containing protein [Burkholderiales bacterium]HNU12545.1 MOSC N-terminal beta barrel domain-containing protein [Rubrivivax sp.]
MTEHIDCRIAALNLHPIKSCAAVPVDEALLIETGLQLDRAWMVVDAKGVMLTQRAQPRMALVQVKLREDDMVLRAPGMLALHVSLDAVEAASTARVWRDEVKAYDMGALAAQWFSDFLGTPARLVRFDPEQKRLADRRWTGEIEAEVAFADGYPLLLASTASLAELNRRLAAQGLAAVGAERFRANLWLDGMQPHDEDRIEELTIEAEGGPVRLRPAKPCVRCVIPNVDPTNAKVGDEPWQTLSAYRTDARVDGGVTFGMNTVILEGIDRVLRIGQPVQAILRS